MIECLDGLEEYIHKGKQVLFFLFPVSSSLLRSFPVPIYSGIEAFLNFSDDPQSEFSASTRFDPVLNLFHLKEAKLLIFGVVGESPSIDGWASDWLSFIQQTPEYRLVAKRAKIMSYSEIFSNGLSFGVDPSLSGEYDSFAGVKQGAGSFSDYPTIPGLEQALGQIGDSSDLLGAMNDPSTYSDLEKRSLDQDQDRLAKESKEVDIEVPGIIHHL